jgi:hypothetical protein
MAEYGEPDAFSALKSQWDNFLEQPGGRTALLQFGINMMQPPSFGDTGISQVGRAIGSAGEAVTRQSELERKEMESESKADLAASRGYAAELRAENAGQRSSREGERLMMTRERLDNQKRQQDLTTRYNLLRSYQAYRREAEKANAKVEAAWNDPVAAAMRPKGAVKPPPQPVMSEDEFLASPLSRAYLDRAGMAAPPPSAAPAAPPASPTLTGRPVPAGGVVDVTTPDEANALPVGTRYRTPEGKLYTR